MAYWGWKKFEPVPFIIAALNPDSTGGSEDMTA
jgi:hypothetical protein